MPLVFALTMFLSATLLFLVQPMIGKMILPKFGGTPAVWTTCMLFFQAALLAGYGYAHLAPSWLGSRRQVLVHLGLLLLPFIVLPIAVAENYAPPADAFPAPYVLALLLLTVGLPFFVVSTSAPLLQQWFANTGHHSSSDPYFLYAASNLGSMVALFGYPALVEPYLRLQSQGWVWTIGYAVLVAATAGCALLVWKSPSFALADAANTVTPPPPPLPPIEPEAVGGADKSPGGNGSADPSEETAATAVTARKPKGKRKPRASSAAIKTNAPGAMARKADLKSEGQTEATGIRSDAVTWGRRLLWVALAFVPSSLMLSVTTYYTTDIAAIPLLWVIPLAVYLLTFILVFSSYGRTFLVAIIGAVLFLGAVAALFLQGDSSTMMGMVLGLLLLAGAGMLGVGIVWGRNELRGQEAPLTFLRHLKAENAGHLMLVLIMPVGILLLVFMILSDVGPKLIETKFLLHLALLFIVAMVCHGELARSRPPTRYLTEFYLWMSFGGMLGGLFNALAAPLLFDRVAEYQLTLIVACLVLPTLGQEKKTKWTRILDVGLPVVLAVLAFALILRRWLEYYFALGRENDELAAKGKELIDYTFWTPADVFLQNIGVLLYNQPLWKWALLAIIAAALGYLLWAILTDVLARKKGMLLDRALDIGTALALVVLATGIMLRSPLSEESSLVSWFVDQFKVVPERVIAIITYGLPALFCYIFVERPVRFGFCVAAFLLAGSLTGDLLRLGPPGQRVLHRERSFFGAIYVEENGAYHRLLHGTTLHGTQYFNSDEEMVGAFVAPLMAVNPLEVAADNRFGLWMWDKRREPLTYYHRDGPIGQVMAQLQARKELPHLAVIGLGTGTMASYAQPGQQLTYYEIDPTVKRIAEDRSLFTYIGDARDRGVKLHIEMGDARLRLKDAPEHEYGLIVVDAFSSDAIPIHLITKQAVELDMDKLAEDGILAYHISNRHLKLEPVLVNLAQELGLAVLSQSDDEDKLTHKAGSHWVMLARNYDVFGKLQHDLKRWPTDPEYRWTDPLHKCDAAKLSDADLTQWKEGYLRRLTRGQGLSSKAEEELKDRVTKMSSDEARRKIQEEIDEDWDTDEKLNQRVGIWTDDFSNILRVFNFR